VGLLRCTECGGEELSLDVRPQGRFVVCETCGASRPHSTERRCATCGRGGLVTRPRPLMQYSRGTQLSIVRWVDLDCCPDCDADALAKSTNAGAPLPAGYEPAARQRRGTAHTPDPVPDSEPGPHRKEPR
jgi:hypothetical protein